MDPATVSAFMVHKVLNERKDTRKVVNGANNLLKRKKGSSSSEKRKKVNFGSTPSNGHVIVKENESRVSKKVSNKRKRKRAKDRGSRSNVSNYSKSEKEIEEVQVTDDDTENEEDIQIIQETQYDSKVSSEYNEAEQSGKQIRADETQGTPKLDFMSYISSYRVAPFDSSYRRAESLFEWILSPLDVDTFLRTNWEKEPVHIKKNDASYFKILMKLEDIDEIIRNNSLRYTENIDVTLYTNDTRYTYNPKGIATPQAVWDYYKNECSIRLLNPHLFHDNINFLNETLQEYFGCFVGANVYLTPPKSQGFAPHYDDIEAFVLQIHGKKYWKVYRPSNVNVGELPRCSSRNFSAVEVGEPMMEVELVAGDVLYFPKGYIHQGYTGEECSLHITVSAYQRTAWIDLLKQVVPKALNVACEKDVEYRRGLPLQYLKSAGYVRNTSLENVRSDLINNVKHLLRKLEDYICVDDGVDKLGMEFIHTSLPPNLTSEEKRRCHKGNSTKLRGDGTFLRIDGLTQDTEIKLIRESSCRLCRTVVKCNNGKRKITYRLHYTTENSKEYNGKEINYLLVPKHMVDCVRHLILSADRFTPVRQFPQHNSVEEKLQLLDDLWERGLILTRHPLPTYQCNFV